MFKRHFLFRCLVLLFLLFLLGVGYHFYNSHTEFKHFMNDHLQFEKTFLATAPQSTAGAPPSAVPQDTLNGSAALRDRPWTKFDKHEWETYWSNYGEPVKVGHIQTGTPPGDGEIVDGTVQTGYITDLIPQLVETPDGQVHKILWFWKLRPGDPLPPREAWPVMTKVEVNGGMYDVPLGEDSDEYIDKIRKGLISPEESLVRPPLAAEMDPRLSLDTQSDPFFPPSSDNQASAPTESYPPDTRPAELLDSTHFTPDRDIPASPVDAEFSDGFSSDSFDASPPVPTEIDTEDFSAPSREMSPEPPSSPDRERPAVPARDVPTGHTHSDGSYHAEPHSP